MNNKYKLKEGITSDFLSNTKFDVREWSEADKTLWQEAMFSLRFSWGGTSIIKYLDMGFYYLGDFSCISQDRSDLDFFHEQQETELFWQDIFEPITLEQTEQSQESVSEPLQEELPAEEYNWVKKEFTLASEAMLAFESGIELFHLVDNNHCKCNTESSVFYAYRNDYLYIKEQLPWWEIVSKEKPIYTIIKDRYLVKFTGAITEEASKRYTPLTEEKVKDIVETMEKWK